MPFTVGNRNTVQGAYGGAGAFSVLALPGLKLWLKSDAGLTLSTSGYAGSGVVSQTGNTLTGVASAFLSEVVIGDNITATGINETVTAIADNTHLTLSGSLSSGAGLTYTITPVAGSSDRVTTWADQSGLGNNFTQATAASKPSKKLSVKNGLAGVRMNGYSHTLTNAGINPLTGFTLFVVASLSNGLDTANLVTFDAGASNVPLVLSKSGDTGNSFDYEDTDAAFHTLSIAGTGINVMSVSHLDGSYERGYFNSGTTVFNTAAASVSTTGKKMDTLGSDGIGSNFAGSDFGEIILCVPVLSAANITATMAYLAGRWA